MDFVTILGSIAGFVSAIALFPQAFKIWKTKSTRDIALWTYVLYSFNLLLWGIYGFLIEAWPLLITEIVTGILTLYILIMKLKGLKD